VIASMGAATLFNLLALAALVGVPGWLLHRAFLRRLGLSWRVSITWLLAGLSVLFSDLAAAFHYQLWLMMAAWSVALIVMLAMWLAKVRQAQGSQAPTLGPEPDWLFHLFVVSIFVAPAFILFVPLDTDAQGFGYLALMVREGGTIHTLAPWQPEVEYLYSPALFVWWAFLSDLLHLPLHQVMLPFSHLMGGVAVLLNIDLARAFMPEAARARWILPLTTIFGLGLFLALMDSHYTTVTALVFVILFLVLAFQSVQHKQLELGLMASVALAAVALTHPDTTIILLLGYVPFYATFWISRAECRTPSAWLQLFVLIPAVGVVLTIPWLYQVWPLFFEEYVASPFVPSGGHMTQLVVYQGVLIPLLAVFGLILGARRRSLPDVLMLAWAALLVDFSIFGLLDTVIDLTGLDIMRYAYPFSIAWHGPALVYPYLATVTVEHVLERWPIRLPRVLGIAGLIIGVAGVMLIVFLQRPLLTVTRPWLNFYGAFASRADLAAMAYLRENTPPSALILNYPLGFEGHWVPVIAERESVAFRDQPFFSGAEPYYERARVLSDLYFNLGQSGAHETLVAYGVAYIVIPQIAAEPGHFEDTADTLRWRWPQDAWYPLETPPTNIGWLELVFEQDGAQVWRVLP